MTTDTAPKVVFATAYEDEERPPGNTHFELTEAQGEDMSMTVRAWEDGYFVKFTPEDEAHYSTYCWRVVADGVHEAVGKGKEMVMLRPEDRNSKSADIQLTIRGAPVQWERAYHCELKRIDAPWLGKGMYLIRVGLPVGEHPDDE